MMTMCAIIIIVDRGGGSGGIEEAAVMVGEVLLRGAGDSGREQDLAELARLA